MRLQQKKIFLRWLPAVLIMAIIFLASSTPDYNLPSFGLSGYPGQEGWTFPGLLSINAGLFARSGKWDEACRHYLRWYLRCCTPSATNIHQSFVPGRSPAITDVLIDMAGAGLAVWIANYYSPLKRFIHSGTRLSTDK